MLSDMDPTSRRSNGGAERLCKAAQIIATPVSVGLDAKDGPWLANQLDLDFRSESASAIPYQALSKMIEDATRDSEPGPLRVSASLLAMHARAVCSCR